MEDQLVDNGYAAMTFPMHYFQWRDFAHGEIYSRHIERPVDMARMWSLKTPSSRLRDSGYVECRDLEVTVKSTSGSRLGLQAVFEMAAILKAVMLK